MDNLRKYLPLACFILVPFGFLADGLVHNGQQFAFLIAGLLIVASMVKNNAITLFMIYFACWQVVLFLAAMGNPAIVRESGASLGVMVFFMAGCVAFLAITSSHIKKEIFYNVICISSLIQAVIAAIQALGFDPVVSFMGLFVESASKLEPGVLLGTLGNNNYLAAYLAISLPFFFREKWAYLIPVIAVELFLANTAMAIVAVYAGATFYVLITPGIKYRYLSILAMGLFVLYYVFSYHPSILRPTLDTSIPVAALPTEMERPNMWGVALRQVGESPLSMLFGMGPGANWGRRYPLHSEWIAAIYHFGCLGAGLLNAYIITVFCRKWSLLRENAILLTSLIVIIVDMAGNSALHFAPSAFLIIMVCALLERELSWQVKQ